MCVSVREKEIECVCVSVCHFVRLLEKEKECACESELVSFVFRIR